MSDGIVFARQAGTLAHNGQRIRVIPGEPWRADDPLVRRYPSYFADHLPAVRSTEDPRGWVEHTSTSLAVDEPTPDEPTADEQGEPSVERATAAPGERRQTRRPGKTGGRAGG